jgi:PAS domain S-box-containing protein
VIKNVSAGKTKLVSKKGHNADGVISIAEQLTFFESLAAVGMWQTNDKGEDVYWSDEFYRLHGLKPQSIHPSAELRLSMIHPDDQSTFLREFKQASQVGACYAVEKRLLLHDGSVKWVLSKGEVRRDSRTSVISRIGVIIDITTQKLAELEKSTLERRMYVLRSQSLQKSLNDFQQALSKSFIVSRADRRGVITYVNEGFTNISGFSKDELIGQDHRIVNSGLHSKTFWMNMWKTISQGKIWRADVRNKTKDGTFYWVDTFVMPFSDDDGKVQEFLSIRSDITTRKQQEENIIELNRSLMDFQQALTDSSIVSRADRAGRITFVNENFVKISGYSQEELVGENHRVVNSGHHPKSFWSEMWRTISGGKIWRGDVKNKAKDGTFYWVDTFVMPFLDENNRIKEYLSVRNDITSRKQSEKELRISRERAEKANKAKSEFLANMSHEIRTPLNGVIGFTELLAKTSLDDTQNQYVALVNQSANNLLDIVNNVLDFSKIEAGKIEISNEPTDLHTLCKQVVAMIGPLAMQKNIALLFFYDDLLPRVVSIDPVRFKQILANLLGNAIKFTEQGEIELKVEASVATFGTIGSNDNSAFRFSVRDTGIGIREENFKKIFNSFSQEDASVTKRYGGTGLGLSISNKLLQLMGSRLQLSSQLGKGSTFYFDVLLSHRAASAPNVREKDASNVIVRNERSDNVQQLADKKLRILVAEDNIINMSLVKAIIGNISAAMSIIEARDGKQAIRLFQEEKPDIVFMDIQMPEMNGYEATTQIRELEAGHVRSKRTPIIALTAGATPEEHEKSMHAGMDDFITKPIEENAIEKVLLKLISELKIM